MMTEKNETYLDDEERNIIEAYKRGEFKTVENFKESKKDHEKTAINTLRQKKAISIRVQQGDINRIKKLADKDGIGYQTLISSIIHRYAEGTLKRQD